MDDVGLAKILTSVIQSWDHPKDQVRAVEAVIAEVLKDEK